MTMVCECPVCGKRTETVSTLLSHIENIREPSRQVWLYRYCDNNNIDLGKVLKDRANGVKNASRLITEALKRDYCEDL